MHALHALPHDIRGRCMQLLHELCRFDFVLNIPLSPATLDATYNDKVQNFAHFMFCRDLIFYRLRL